MSDPKTSVASYAASGSLVVFGMSANDLAVLLGVVFAAATFAINWYYKHQHLKLLAEKIKLTPSQLLEDEG